jgi:hypothetical protein
MRGLPWKNDTGLVELSGWEYGTRTREIAEVLGTEDLGGFSQLAVAGGMLPEGTDLASLAVAFTAATAGATYSPLDRQVLLLASHEKRGTRPDQSLLTHEFVHALQDQHFDLLRTLVARPYNFDRTEATFALVEGDAMNVERRLELGEKEWAKLTLDSIARQQDERFAPYRARIGWLFPPLLTETFIFRYRDGLRFVETMRRARPSINVDDLFRRPPASSEQVLHPEKYLAREEPIDVTIDVEALIDEGWELQASTPLGEIGVRGLLMAGVSDREAEKASSGWGGDRAFVLQRKGTPPIFIWKTVWDGNDDAREFFAAHSQLQAGSGAKTRNGSYDNNEESWREGSIQTLVKLDGNSVLILRGPEADVTTVLKILTRG